MKSIFTESAPEPAGHYSQAMVHEGLVFVSGQLAVDPISGEKRLVSIAEQTRQVLENLDAILVSASSDRAHVLKTTVYIADIELWNDVNEVYAEFFGAHKPARAIVPTKNLHFGFLIELEAIAVQI